MEFVQEIAGGTKKIGICAYKDVSYFKIGNVKILLRKFCCENYKPFRRFCLRVAGVVVLNTYEGLRGYPNGHHDKLRIGRNRGRLCKKAFAQGGWKALALGKKP